MATGYSVEAEEQHASKRIRLTKADDGGTSVPGTPQDDVDDFYETPGESCTPKLSSRLMKPQEEAGMPNPVNQNIPKGIPGLGLLESSEKLRNSSTQSSLPPSSHIEDNGERAIERDGISRERSHLGDIPGLGNGTQATAEINSSSPDGTANDQTLQSTSHTQQQNQPNGSHGDPFPYLRSLLGNKEEEAHERSSARLTDAEETQNDAENVEWEFDSSESGSDTTSSASSSSSDEAGEEYELLDPEEQARILMREEAGSENGDIPGGVLRTAHELPDETIEKPNVTITPGMKLVELGAIDKIVGNMTLVKATVSGEYQVLDTGSVLCLGDRTVVGAVAETLGRVHQPLYSLGFQRAAEIHELGIEVGTKIFYVEDFAKYVFTQQLRMMRGTDASNEHDEEPDPNTLEFSDDEAEAAHRQALKRGKKVLKQVGPSFPLPTPRRPQPPKTSYRGGFHSGSSALSYDEADDDLYTPLARPENLHHMMGSGEAPLEERRVHGQADRGRSANGRVGRGRGGRGRWNQSRGYSEGRGGRGGRMGQEQRFYSQDPRGQFIESHPVGPNSPPQFVSSSPHTPAVYSHTMNNAGSPQAGQFAFQPFPPPQPPSWPQPPSNFGTPDHLPQQMHALPLSPTAGLPAGAFLNPAFLANQQSHLQRLNLQQPGYHGAGQLMSPVRQTSPLQPWIADENQRISPAQRPDAAQRISPESDAAFRAAQEQLNILRGLRG